MWFQRMDVNADNDLSPASYFRARQRFAELDEDHNGFIDSHEAERADAD